MTTDHQGKYAELVASTLLQSARTEADSIRLIDLADAGLAGAADYLTKAVKDGKTFGLEITEEEAHGYFWLKYLLNSAQGHSQAQVSSIMQNISFPNSDYLAEIYRLYEGSLVPASYKLHKGHGLMAAMRAGEEKKLRANGAVQVNGRWQINWCTRLLCKWKPRHKAH